MSAYDRIKSGRDRLLTNLGVSAKVARVTLTQNEQTGEVTQLTVNTNCKAYLGPNTQTIEDSVNSYRGEIIVNVAVQAGDRIVLAGRTYIADSVEIEAPNGKPILWTAKVSR